MKGRSTGGTTTPVGVWLFSNKQQIVRPHAQSVELSMCTYFFSRPPIFFCPHRISMERDW